MSDTLTEGLPVDPDQGAAGFLATAPDPYRYDGNHDLDPHEVGGMITALVPIGAKVLDVGCGTGALAVVMRDQRDAQVFGIEPDTSRAARAAERGIRVHAGVLSPSLLPSVGQFDVAVYADVLEHLVDPLRELQEVAPFVKSDGLVIISVPNVAHWSVRLDLLRGNFRYARFGIMDATHLRWFTEETIRQLVDQAGMEVVQIRQTAGITLLCYVETRLVHIPKRWRDAVVRRMAMVFPRLFGCQHIVICRFRTPAGMS